MQMKLSNDVLMPRFGLGTYQVRDRNILEQIIPQAIISGYRLVDTAAVYQNEQTIGTILKNALNDYSVRRNEIFITSKIQPSDLGYHSTCEAIDRSIRNLGDVAEGYLDLMLIHWPAVNKRSPSDPTQVEIRAESWRALEEAYQQGKLRSIGVSNYLPRHLNEFLNGKCTVLPHVNQIELHPGCYYAARETIEWCREHNVHVQAYSSLSRGVMLGENFLQHFPWLKQIKLVERYSKGLEDSEFTVPSAGSEHEVDLVLLQWAVQHGFSVLPKSNSPARIARNAFILHSLSKNLLTEEEMLRLDEIGDFVKSTDKEMLSSLGFPTNFITAGKTCWDPEIVK